MFGLKGVSFSENGVVSLNLPPVGPVVGGRATRTTHPRALRLFGDLFSRLLGGPRRVTNPYRHHTKAEVVDAIVRLGFADQIPFTHSCADIHNRTVMHSHCGRCSQCIDRRFAILSRGLEGHDAGEAYAVDLMTGRRRDGTDREMALSYVRNARFFAHASQAEFLVRFPELARALDETERSADEELRRLHDLHRRHGAAVSAVVHQALAACFGCGSRIP